ncbi:MAG TPA: rhomboid family intramembrane serine protease [Candidatus Dwaynia gallinarum]|nr:rhomboid family intramembrane serine protease [Candidatus Dwaynia gallinarum]
MNDKINVSDNENLNINSDTIEVDKDKIIKNLSKRKVFTDNEAFPWLSICLVLVYVFVYGFCVYGKENIVDVDLSSLQFLKVSNGSEILNGSFISLITNIFVHRSIWDLINTIFIIVFCGFFVERYIKRSVILSVYVISIVMFNLLSLFLYPNYTYLGSFTIVSFLIGMCIYFSYRFKRFVMTIDIYIYVALTFIGFFISYMVNFYNIFQFVLSYLVGVFVVFILDTKALRKSRKS